jgi:hypothetical protein
MPIPRADSDWDDEYDADAIDEEALDDDEPTTSCPYCREEIHEDAQRCPSCGHYISEEDAPPAAKPWWVLLGAALGLYAAYRWVVMQ